MTGLFDPAIIADGRREAEALMLDTATVRRRTGFTTQNETTGQEVPTTTVVFTTPCKLQSRSRLGDSFIGVSQYGGHQGTSLDIDIHIPLSKPPVLTDDLITVTSPGAFTDPQMEGRVFRVLASPSKSFATARRIPVQEAVA